MNDIPTAAALAPFTNAISHGPMNPRLAALQANRNVIPDLETVDLNLADLSIAKTEQRGVYSVKLGDEDIVTSSDRFQASLLGLIGQGASIFNLFEFEEIVDRFLARNSTREAVKLTIDRTNNRALGIVNRDKAQVQARGLAHLLEQFQGDDLSFIYEDGRILSKHVPGSEFERLPQFFGGDEHHMQFYLDCPVDAYGIPSIYVGLLRAICTNGAVAMTPAFRRSINIPPNVTNPFDTIRRQLEQYSIGEVASSAIGKKMALAASTPASVREYRNFYRMATRLFDGNHDHTGNNRIHQQLEKISEGIAHSLDLPSLSVFDDRPSSRVPVNYSVYDLLNMATELATHFRPSQTHQLHGFVGRMLEEKQYDLQALQLPAPEALPFHFLGEEEQMALVA